MSRDLFDRLRRRLSARGVPAAYVSSLVEELQDHCRQSVSAGMAENDALAALGDEEEIVRTTLNSLRRDSFVGRHRISLFVIAPILAYPILLILVGIPLGMLGDWLVTREGIARSGVLMHVWKWTTELSINLALPIACLFLFSRLIRRGYCSRRLAIFAFGMIAVWSLAVMTAIRLPSGPADPRKIMLSVGVYWPVRGVDQRILFFVYIAMFIRWLIQRRRLNSNLQSI